MSRMPHTSVSLREANQNFSRLVAAVERGEMFSITRRGLEVARLTPPGAMVAAVEVKGGNADANSGGGHAAMPPIPLTEAALAERMLRLEALVDKLLAALSSSRHR